jgi:hypothetical protein
MKSLIDRFPRDRWYLRCECGELLVRRRPGRGIPYKAEKKFTPDGSDKTIIRYEKCGREKKVPIMLIR